MNERLSLSHSSSSMNRPLPDYSHVQSKVHNDIYGTNNEPLPTKNTSLNVKPVVLPTAQPQLSTKLISSQSSIHQSFNAIHTKPKKPNAVKEVKADYSKVKSKLDTHMDPSILN